MTNIVIPEYEREFVRLLYTMHALKFGEFTLKSGRVSPYFLNMGDFNTGKSLRKLAGAFASLVHNLTEKEEIPAPTYLFGPPYKGIALAFGAAMQMDEQYDQDVKWGSVRKELKGHGDKGMFYGAVPQNDDKILIFDDVFTTGKTKEEAVEQIRIVAPESSICGVVIAANRCEVGADNKTSAIGEFYNKYGIKTYSITDIHRIVKILHNQEIDGKVALTDQNKANIEKYLEKYGVSEVA
jgi:orotate phosphoribosyltransferase